MWNNEYLHQVFIYFAHPPASEPKGYLLSGDESFGFAV